MTRIERNALEGEAAANTSELPPARSNDTPWSREDKLRLHISKRLETLHDSIVEQPIPDRFIDLINAIGSAERKC